MNKTINITVTEAQAEALNLIAKQDARERKPYVERLLKKHIQGKYMELPKNLVDILKEEIK